jgi:hypothetical protein
MRQTETPLSSLFFSDFNLRRLQNNIRSTFKTKTGIAIDYQNKNDVLTLMRMIFINNSYNPYGNLPEQVKLMNSLVVDKAVEQIGTGISEYIGYMKDISTPLIPEARPIQTSYYGEHY